MVELINEIAEMYQLLAENTKALEFLQQGLDILKKMSRRETENVETAEQLNKIGGVHDEMGEFKKAIKCYSQALKIRKKIHNDDCHLSIAKTLEHLGYSHCCLGRVNLHRKDLAVDDQVLSTKYYEESLDVYKKYYKGNDHQDIADILLAIGMTYFERVKIHEAFEFFHQSVSMMKRIHKHDHPGIAYGLSQIGIAYLAKCKNKNNSKEEANLAMKYFKDSMDMYNRLMRDGEYKTTNVHSFESKFYFSSNYNDYCSLLQNNLKL